MTETVQAPVSRERQNGGWALPDNPHDEGLPLRVLQVNSLMHGGGVDNQTLELSAGLRDLGCEVTLLVPAGCRWERRAKDLGVVAVETFAQKPSPRRAFFQSIASVVRRKKIQIVHAHQGRDYWPAFFATKLARPRASVVGTRHLMTRPRWFSRWGLLTCANVIGVSEAVMGVLRLELHGPRSRLHRVFGGIDVKKFSSGDESVAEAFRKAQCWTPEHVVFGVIGAYGFPRGKGQLEFIHAAAKVHRQHPNARFALIGDGDMGPMLQNEISELKLRHVFRVIPFTEKIVAATQALDVLVHPAIGSEAFGLVILEAMACGKPVIASRLDGIPELFREGMHGLLTKPGDVPELADAMSCLLSKPDLRAEFGAAARLHAARQFSRETMARRTLQIYLNLCGAMSHATTTPCHRIRRTILR